METESDKLENILQGINRHGFETVSLRWAVRPDCTITWEQIAHRDATIAIPDYLTEAPDEVLKEAIEHILAVCEGTQDRRTHPKAIRQYCASPGFAERWQDTYLARNELERTATAEGGAAIVRSLERTVPTWSISTVFRVIGCRPEYLGNQDKIREATDHLQEMLQVFAE